MVTEVTELTSTMVLCRTEPENRNAKTKLKTKRRKSKKAVHSPISTRSYIIKIRRNWKILTALLRRRYPYYSNLTTDFREETNKHIFKIFHNTRKIDSYNIVTFIL